MKIKQLRIPDDIVTIIYRTGNVIYANPPRKGWDDLTHDEMSDFYKIKFYSIGEQYQDHMQEIHIDIRKKMNIVREYVK